ncbi:MAG: archaeosortase A, partial [Thermoplasmata archaeon]
MVKQIYGLPIVPRWITGIVCFTGLGLLSAGHLWKDRRRYLLSIAGWIIYGIFWLINIPATNLFNATFFVIGNIFFWYFAYHEYLSYRWNESCTGLEFVRGTSALSSVLYFLIDYNPWLSGHLIWIVSANTAWALNILGITPPHDNPRFASFPEYSADGIEYGDEVKVHIDGSSINIILACTAIEAIVIFIAGLIMTKSTWARRLRGLAITLPTIWIGNIIR